jgi:hypothetical protein
MGVHERARAVIGRKGKEREGKGRGNRHAIDHAPRAWLRALVRVTSVCLSIHPSVCLFVCAPVHWNGERRTAEDGWLGGLVHGYLAAWLPRRVDRVDPGV